MRPLLRSHRTMGYEVARTATDDGRALVILQTAPHRQEVAPAHAVLPVSEADATFEARIALTDAIARARFLGLDAETITRLFTEELMKEAQP